jgi:hypothetical protein
MYCFVSYSIKCHDLKIHTVKVKLKVQRYVKSCFVLIFLNIKMVYIKPNNFHFHEIRSTYILLHILII